MTRAVRSWEEQDAYTGWRRYLRWRPGELARVKRRTHKRERRDARAEIAAQAGECADRHHHEERVVAGMTLTEVHIMAVAENIPADAMFDASDSEQPMIGGEGFIPVPVLTWRVEDP